MIEFDLYDLLVNELTGTVWLFLLISILVIFIICLKFNLSHQIGIVFSIILVSLLVAYDPDWIYLYIAIVIVVFALAGREFKKIIGD